MSVSYLDAVLLPDGRMDVATAARYIGVRKATLAQWRWQGSGPPFIKPGKIYYFKKDLDEWLMRGGLLTTTPSARRQRQQEQEARELVGAAHEVSAEP